MSAATGGSRDESGYGELRNELLDHPAVGERLPRFVRSCRDLDQFWGFIKKQFEHYAERREFLWGQFGPVIEYLVGRHGPSHAQVSVQLASLDSDSVHQAWEKAMFRIAPDPEGAITQARSLLESVCKVILDEAEVPYEPSVDLPRLYKMTAKVLNLSPGQHAEQVFKQVLSGCTSVVEGLGSLRNRFSDAHGRGKRAPKPSDRHARLAVNLAGGMSLFLAETWKVRHQEE